MGQKASKIGPFAQAVNAELRARIAWRGYNQTRLAEATGIPQTSISNYIYRETAALTVHNLELICTALGVTPSDVVAAAESNISAFTEDGYRLAAKTDTHNDVNEEDYL